MFGSSKETEGALHRPSKVLKFNKQQLDLLEFTARGPAHAVHTSAYHQAADATARKGFQRERNRRFRSLWAAARRSQSGRPNTFQSAMCYRAPHEAERVFLAILAHRKAPQTAMLRFRS